MPASEAELVQCLDLLTVGSAETLQEPRKSRLGAVRKILADPNTLGVGIARKVTHDIETNVLAITFYVRSKKDETALLPATAVPRALDGLLPDAYGLLTDVVELGEIVPQPVLTATPQVGIDRTVVQPGNSIGLSATTTGTFGAVVSDGNKLLALSNNHILADCDRAQPGDPIFYPGPFDGGAAPNDVVGTLAKSLRLQLGSEYANRGDAAVAELSPAAVARLNRKIRILDALPRRVREPRRDMPVIMVGRTSGKQQGRVIDVNFRCTLDYPTGPVSFLDQVLCTPFTRDGDSGSLVLDLKTGDAVGLHFAFTTDQQKRGGSVFSPLRPILDALEVKLVTR